MSILPEDKNHIAHFIWQKDGFLKEEMLQALENFYECNEGRKQVYDKNYRSCDIIDIVPRLDGPLYQTVLKEVHRAANEYRQELDASRYLFRLTNVETPHYIRYRTGNDFFHTHVDAWEKNTAERGLSLIFYLSDCEGGETEFPDILINQEPLKVAPKRNRVVIFPSVYPYAHRGNHVVEGTKDIIVTWLRFA